MTRPVVLYDGGCRPCRGFARALLWVDRRGALALLPFDDPVRTTLVPDMPDEVLRASMHLVLPDGSVASAGAAVAGVLRAVRGPFGLLGALGRFASDGMAARVTERAYRAVADNRGRFGRFVPDVPAVRRHP